MVYFKLTLKRRLLSDCTLRISLFQNGKDLLLSSQVPHESPLEKQRTTVELDHLHDLSHLISPEDTTLQLRYEIKGRSEDRIRTLNVDAGRMLEEYRREGNSLFEEKVSGAKDDIVYMVSVNGESEGGTASARSGRLGTEKGGEKNETNSMRKSPVNSNLGRG